jgi:hypothetical protein
MNAKQIKAGLYQFATYDIRSLFVMDEFGHYCGLSDMAVVLPSHFWIDIEIKVSIADLKTEHKKVRHNFWNDTEWQSLGRVPNYFAFCVPLELLDRARPIIEAGWPFAGIFSATWVIPRHNANHPFCRIKREKKIKRIHGQKLSDEIILRHAHNLSYRYAKIWCERVYDHSDVENAEGLEKEAKDDE